VSARYDVPALRDGLFLPHAMPSQIKRNEDPLTWETYDLAGWGLFIAYDDETPIGACAIARDVDSLYFDTAPDKALVWDIRVDLTYRNLRIAKSLLKDAMTWSRTEGIQGLLIETQDTNVTACALYASDGATVVVTRAGACEDCPDEVLIVWRR